jgi:hypothetical protein
MLVTICFAMAAINVLLATLGFAAAPINWAAATFCFGMGIATAINSRR